MLTPKEIEYFESQLPEGSKVVSNLSDLLENHYAIVTRLEGLEQYPKFIQDSGNRMDVASEIAVHFTSAHKDTVWGEDLLWDEEVEKFVKQKLKELED